jgi:hypothetical protein
MGSSDLRLALSIPKCGFCRPESPHHEMISRLVTFPANSKGPLILLLRADAKFQTTLGEGRAKRSLDRVNETKYRFSSSRQRQKC